MSFKLKEYREGFSLIELIITIAILTVLVGGATLSLGLLRSADTKGLASGINNSLTDLKSLTESHQGPYYLRIYKVDDDGFYANFSNKDASEFTLPSDPSGDEKLGASQLRVEAVDKDGAVIPISSASEDTGASFVTVKIRKKDGAYEMSPTTFSVYNGDSLEYSVHLVKDTGLHYMVKE